MLIMRTVHHKTGLIAINEIVLQRNIFIPNLINLVPVVLRGKVGSMNVNIYNKNGGRLTNSGLNVSYTNYLGKKRLRQKKRKLYMLKESQVKTFIKHVSKLHYIYIYNFYIPV